MLTNGICIQWVGFRWVKPAASLKRHSAERRQHRPAISFRWVKPAASLKHRNMSRFGASIGAFPLGKTGGLIEASAGTSGTP